MLTALIYINKYVQLNLKNLEGGSTSNCFVLILFFVNEVFQ